MDDNRRFYSMQGYLRKKSADDGVSPAMEDYLEMIARLSKAQGHTRIGLLSDALHVKPSSSSKMVAKLRELGFVAVGGGSVVCLTAQGKALGTYFLYRHDTLERFLSLLGSPDPLTEAEMIEHHLSETTVAAMARLIDESYEKPLREEETASGGKRDDPF